MASLGMLGPRINEIATEYIEAIYDLIREFGPINIAELIEKAKAIEELAVYSDNTLQKIVETAAFHMLYNTYGRVDILDKGHKFVIRK